MSTPGSPTSPTVGAPADAGPAGDGAGGHRVALRRWLPRVLVGVFTLLVVLGGWVAWRGVQAADALRAAMPVAADVQDDLRSGDLAAAAERLPHLQSHAADAVAASSDPVWRAMTGLPWLGPHLSAVSDVSTAFEMLASDVLPVVTDVGGAVDSGALAFVDGRIDLGPLVAAGPPLREAVASAEAAQALVDGIDTRPLVDLLADPVRDAQGRLGEATEVLRVASTAAELVPSMLGATEERRYLVLVLNPAELRSGGGIVGAVLLLSADDGALELVDHRAARDLPEFDTAVLELGAQEREVHTGRLGTIMQNVTLTPEFPRTAEIAAQMWRQAVGDEVDGVLTTDPVALSYLLDAIGPVQEGSGPPLEARTVVDVLLAEAYVEHPDPDETDLFFARTAATVFSALTAAPGDDLGAVVTALTDAVTERRVMVWSTRDEEQQHFAREVVGGAYLTGADDDAVGVFLDDATGSKMGYYLEGGVRVDSVSCPAASADDTGGATGATAVVRLDLTSGAPEDLAGLPEYVVGFGADGVPAGTVRTNVTVYAPTDGAILGIRRGGAQIGGRDAAEGGRDVVVLTSTLAPGESESYEIEVALATGDDPVEVWTTPSLMGPGRLTAPGC